MKGYLDAKELESYKKEDLQELAKQLGVDAEGTKKEIAARCAAVEVDIPDNSELTEEDKKVAAEAAAEAAAKAEEEKAAAEAAAKVEEEKAAAEAAAKAEEEKQAEAGTKETKEAIAALDERLKRVESGWGIDYKHDAVLGLCYMGAAYMSQHYERTVETAVLGATYVGNSYLENTF